MAYYVVRRTLEMALVVLLVITFNFLLIHIAPGDPATTMAGEMATPEYVQAIREKYGLNKPVYEQLLLYLVNVLRGDLGVSFAYHEPVLEMIIEKTPATLLLVVPSLLISFTFGTLLGALSAKKYGSKTDNALSLASLTMYSMPIFWFGLILMLLFGIRLGWFPIMGMTSVEKQFDTASYIGDLIWHLLLPTLTLSLTYMGPLFLRIARSSVIEVMKEDFITAERAEGLTENAIFYKHALRNALLPSITQLGLMLGFVMAGAMVTETVYGWPGLGYFMYQSIFTRDYPVMMGLFIVTSIGVVVASLITDLSYAFLDPRVVYK